MKEEFRITANPHSLKSGFTSDFINKEAAEKVRSFHSTFPDYAPTPLVKLTKTAKALGVGEIFVKDESYRFGLNAFKVLGGSYAIGKYLSGKSEISSDEMSFDALTSAETKEKCGELTFVTATDGNHGRGVARAARDFGHKAVVYMPEGSASERLENIRKEGAYAEITDMNYDDAVRLADRHASEKGWILIQDTDREGYTKIPSHIMQGYTTMGLEAFEQLDRKPTHIFLQAGVGAMAGSMAGLFSSLYPEERPIITIVEPNKADCLYKTAEADDGELHFVTCQLDTIMAGLACGEPCGIAWEILRSCADFFISCPDYAAESGMRLLARPYEDDTAVVSGESGSACFGCVTEILTDEKLSHVKEMLGINESSVLLFFSTEGATDMKNYNAVVNKIK